MREKEEEEMQFDPFAIAAGWCVTFVTIMQAMLWMTKNEWKKERIYFYMLHTLFISLSLYRPRCLGLFHHPSIHSFIVDAFFLENKITERELTIFGCCLFRVREKMMCYAGCAFFSFFLSISQWLLIRHDISWLRDPDYFKAVHVVVVVVVYAKYRKENFTEG